LPLGRHAAVDFETSARSYGIDVPQTSLSFRRSVTGGGAFSPPGICEQYAAPEIEAEITPAMLEAGGWFVEALDHGYPSLGVSIHEALAKLLYCQMRLAALGLPLLKHRQSRHP
jgi:hypothetical protein